MTRVAVLAMAAVVMVAGAQAADPVAVDTRAAIAASPISPDMLRALADLSAKGVDVAPLISVIAQRGGAVGVVDVTATKEAAKTGNIFTRNWGKWTSGIIAAGGLYLIGDNNDWWESGSGGGDRTQNNENNGHTISVNTGNESPVTININQPAEEAEEAAP